MAEHFDLKIRLSRSEAFNLGKSLMASTNMKRPEVVAVDLEFDETCEVSIGEIKKGDER